MSYFQVQFKDKKFFASIVGSSTPEYLQNSFVFESRIRDKWWDIKEGDIVIDVGAAYGSYTLPALAMGAKKVIFFEPSKTEFFDICSNVMLNGWLDRCIPHNCLVGEESGIRDDYYQDSHSFRPEGKKDGRIVLTIDKVLEMYDLQHCDWIKIDTEGAEPEVLKGAKRVISNYKPRILLENHVGFRPGVERITNEFLSSLNYRLVDSLVGTGINDNWSLYEPKE